MLNATRKKYSRYIDVKGRPAKNGNEKETSRKIAAPFGEFVFRIDGMGEDDWLQDNDIYAAFREDAQDEIDRELNNQITEASQNGLADAGVQRLKDSM